MWSHGWLNKQSHITMMPSIRKHLHGLRLMIFLFRMIWAFLTVLAFCQHKTESHPRRACRIILLIRQEVFVCLMSIWCPQKNMFKNDVPKKSFKCVLSRLVYHSWSRLSLHNLKKNMAELHVTASMLGCIIKWMLGAFTAHKCGAEENTQHN